MAENSENTSQMAELPDRWPDQIPGAVGGPRRKISYSKIRSLMDCPRQERILYTYPSDTAAFQATYRLKRKDLELLPNGVWHFYSRTIKLLSQNKIVHAALGVFFAETDRPMLMFPDMRHWAPERVQAFEEWREALGTGWMTIEEQFNTGLVGIDAI